MNFENPDFWVGLLAGPFFILGCLIIWNLCRWVMHFGSKAAVNFAMRLPPKATNRQRAALAAVGYGAKRAQFLVIGNIAFSVMVGLDATRHKHAIKVLEPPVKLTTLFPSQYARKLTDEFFAEWDRQFGLHAHAAMERALKNVEDSDD